MDARDDIETQLIEHGSESDVDDELTEAKRYPSFGQRMRMERQLFGRQFCPLFLSLVMLVYGALIVFRNLAFYRYRVGPRLRDVGFEVFHEFSKENMKYSDIPIKVMYIVDGFVLLGTFLGEGGAKRIKDAITCLCGKENEQDLRAYKPFTRPPRPHFVNVVRRMLCVYAIGHFLRACTYLATTLPGSSDHCIHSTGLHPPKTLLECFYKTQSINGNCGDLIFSGHMLFMWLSTCCVLKYGARAWGLKQLGPVHSGLLALCMILIAVQIAFILKSRHHYTVDIVVATYTVPLLWNFYNNTIQPEDLKVDYQALEDHESVPRSRRRVLIENCIVAFALFILVLLVLIVVHGNFNFLHPKPHTAPIN
uniref:Sphingomyelin synthase-like domain-containing protein n=1 Tax=Mucochytrium quahogii TaxID=96639 RepID=A0A7S2W8S8_9STRA|mmetsp:Transcript_19019/g.31117  ORF Transcript_19019/g.31117 Transcript_19019/m.31117 type:complete len:365 (-) Transcript_19019:39-1133(-)